MELRMIESSLQLDMNNARQSRKEVESRAEDVGSARLSELREELRRERVAHESVQDGYSREIGEEVRRLTRILEEQRGTRIEYAEGTMMRMVEDVCSRVRGEIQQERIEREAVQGKLIGLLEDTCNRIEGSFTVGGRPEQLVI